MTHFLFPKSSRAIKYRTRRQITKRQDDRRAHYLGRCVCCLSFNIFLPPPRVYETRIMVVLLCMYVYIVYLSHLIIPGRSIWVAPRQVLRHFWLSSFDVNISRRLLFILILRELTQREATLGWISSTKQKKEKKNKSQKEKKALWEWKKQKLSLLLLKCIIYSLTFSRPPHTI